MSETADDERNEFLLREFDPVVPYLKSIFKPLDDFLTSLPPWSWTACAVAFICLGAVFAFLFRREYIYRGAPDQAAWRDLRIWAAVFLIPFVFIYLLSYLLLS